MRIPSKKIGLLPIIIVLAIFVVFFQFMWKTREKIMPMLGPDGPINKSMVDLSGCKHVYLDVGSNVGIQVRKLFEPQLYKGANVTSVFNTYFGDDINKRRLNVCAVGFEPNTAHTQRLKELEDAYNKCGWRTHFFTETAVSDHNGTGTLFTDRNQRMMEWGASILGGKGTVGQVTLLRLSEFINDYVANRQIASGEPPGHVVMKMDIEGSEVDVLPDMVSSGSLAQVSLMMIEWHPHLARTEERRAAATAVQQLIARAEVEASSVDDESYGKSNFPLPNCDNLAH